MNHSRLSNRICEDVDACVQNGSISVRNDHNQQFCVLNDTYAEVQ